MFKESSDAPKGKEKVMEQPDIPHVVAKPATKKAGKRAYTFYELSRLGEGSQSGPDKPTASQSKTDENQPPESNTKSKTNKRSRATRRHQSKSEPNNEAPASQARESIRRTMIGAQKTEWTGNGSGEGLLPLSPVPSRAV